MVMDDIDACRDTARQLAGQGLDKAYLKESLQKAGYSADSISKVSKEYSSYIRMQDGAKSRPGDAQVALHSKIAWFLINYYLHISIALIVCALGIFLILRPQYLPDALSIGLHYIPKVLIFAIILKSFIELVFNTGQQVSWKSALLLGVIFSLVPTSTLMVGRYWWVVIAILLVFALLIMM